MAALTAPADLSISCFLEFFSFLRDVARSSCSDTTAQLTCDSSTVSTHSSTCGERGQITKHRYEWSRLCPSDIKVTDLFFFAKHLEEFNEARLHGATLNIHTHAWIFSSLSIASVDRKQHLSEAVFTAFVGFSL